MANNAVKILILLVFLIFNSSAFAQERLAVSVSIANIRSGPGTNREVVWQIEKYHPLEVIEKKGNWYRFRDYEGDIGWIHNSLVKNIRTVITKSKKCNVRSGPGTGNAVEFTVEDGIPFKVLSKKGHWIHIEHADGDKGWIHESLVW